MKKIYFLLFALILFTGVNAQIINFPDVNFKAKLLAANSSNTIAKDLIGNWCKIDINNDGIIQVSEALNISYLNVANSNITDLAGIQSFTSLQTLQCDHNQIVSLDISNLINLQILNCSTNLISLLNINNLANLQKLYCNSNRLTSLNTNTLTNLQVLDCGSNQLTSLIVNTLPNLQTLNCKNNQLISLNVSGLINLQSIICIGNDISSLNLNGLINLVSIDCSGNLLSSLDLSGLTNFERITCSYNQMTSLVVSGLPNLTHVYCHHNQLTSLDLSGSTSLVLLDCTNNYLSVLDVSNAENLLYLDCNYNRLTSLFIKNGSVENNALRYGENPTLRYICADESQISSIQNWINNSSLTCEVNSYCSFTPGGTYYSIEGSQKFDLNSDGCDDLDAAFPNMRINKINNGNLVGSYFSDTTGQYSISTKAGTNTYTPVLENPTFFIVSPASITTTFPGGNTLQNFCVSANGVHPDLEITLLPLNPARPGFDAKYKLIYKNKGNQTQSGSVNLTFNDAVLDLVSANPVAINQTVNNLSWNFTNLQPFETREIALTLNVNSPMETPAVNGGDVLNYTATITSATTDETPNDNTFAFNQTVVNSFDPNDKTCLEGATIAPSEVGKYVHYMIRFENTGTFPAENIVVKDMIDTNKFDINSLVPLKGSHSFVTNITSGNKVEFIFENINLPFDDANNDGYVAFKIKTKPTLAVGNTFSNIASIYFDYNFPIVTNTATTTIAALNNQDFSFATYFMLYPNPVNNVLNIETKQTIEVSSINIYNQLGQLVLVVPNAQDVSKVDVSNLASGNYFIKINSDKGTSNTKFIKQ